MGKRGPASTAPGGYGQITPKGYRRVYDPTTKRYRMEHVVVWEAANGPVPPGHQVHHRNEDKLDNRLENLELVDALTHKRLHGGCEVRDGVWWKPCRNCGTFHPIDHYYPRPGAISPWCRACCVTNAVANKRKRRERRDV